MKRYLLPLLVATLSCGGQNAPRSSEAGRHTVSTALAQCPAPSAPPVHGIDVVAMDRSHSPGDDFYLYANGHWVKNAEIPADRTSISGFAALGDRVNHQIDSILCEVRLAQTAPGTDRQRLADLYASYMNEKAVEEHGTQPLAKPLARIAAISTPRMLAAALGHSMRSDVDALNVAQFYTPNLFGLWVAPGFRDPHHYAPYLLQGGLTLPSREYYLDASAPMVEVRKQYADYAATMFRLAGLDHPEARAANVISLETSIAKVQITLADSEDIRKADNLWTAADFKTRAPGMDWVAYLQAASLSAQERFYVWQPTAIAAEAALVTTTPLETWKDFLRLHTIIAYAPTLPAKFNEEHFKFFGTILSGATQQLPRQRRAIDTVNATLGEAVGKLYVERFFPPSSKTQAQDLVMNILRMYRQRLEAVAWMAPSTKAEAMAKLNTLRVNVGYPDRFRTYDGLEVRPDDLAGNLDRAGLFDYRYNIGRIGQPTNPDEWLMTPQTTNALEMPLNNALNFPAAILQPPFFDPMAPLASNYGAIGVVIGHELSHTLDSEGSNFDSAGRVRDWWTAGDREHFEKLTSTLATQLDRYEILPGLHVNGRQTLGENVADLVGLNVALDAYHGSLHGHSDATVGEFNGDQQFFIAFAQNWQVKMREEAQRRQIATSSHAPGPIRAETVRNVDGWYKAFGIRQGETLYLEPEDRVHIF